MQPTTLSSAEYHSSAFTFLSFNFLSNQTEPKKLKFQKKKKWGTERKPWKVKKRWRKSGGVRPAGWRSGEGRAYRSPRSKAERLRPRPRDFWALEPRSSRRPDRRRRRRRPGGSAAGPTPLRLFGASETAPAPVPFPAGRSCTSFSITFSSELWSLWRLLFAPWFCFSLMEFVEASFRTVVFAFFLKSL